MGNAEYSFIAVAHWSITTTGCNGNKGVLYVLHISRTGSSLSDAVYCPIQRALFWGGFNEEPCLMGFISRKRLPNGYLVMSYFYTFIITLFRRCPWCNGYPHRIWTRRCEFNSWTRLIAFHIALIPLGKVWIQLFSLQLWINSRAD